MGREGRPRVTDFGLARQVVQQASAVSSRSTCSPTQIKSERRITAPGTVMGTLSYMAGRGLYVVQSDALQAVQSHPQFGEGCVGRA